MGVIKKFLLGRLREASTWKGIISLVAGVVGWEVTGGQSDAVAGVCVAVYACASVFFPDKFGVTPESSTPLPTPEVSTTAQVQPKLSNEAAWNGKTPGQFP